MTLTIDLTPRQTARVLEQAVRAHSRLEIEAGNIREGRDLIGTLAGRDGNLLTVELPEWGLRGPLDSMVGAFCEVRMVLSMELYMFSSCIVDIIAETDPPRVQMAVPEIIQVANRRQYERTNATVASQVRVWVPGQQAPAVGLVANVSSTGLGCNLPGTALDELLALDDHFRVSFELAGFDECFELPVVLCNKGFGAQSQQLQLGMQFDVHPDDTVAQHSLRRLQAALYDLMSNFSEADGEL